MELKITQKLEKGITNVVLNRNGITAKGMAKCSPDDRFHIGKGADIASARAYEDYIKQEMAQDTKRLREMVAEARMLTARLEHNKKELKRTVSELAVLTK